MMGFSGWSMVGGATTIGTQQGGNILINIFSGLTANAAFGISNQVSSAIYGFVSNFQLAFNPQIVKLYAQKRLPHSTNSFYVRLFFFLPAVNHSSSPHLEHGYGTAAVVEECT